MKHGLPVITTEHLKFRLAPLLAIILTGFMIHGLLQWFTTLSILHVPVIKNKAGKIGCLDNYRLIALASSLSKVIERILFDRVNGYVSSVWSLSHSMS